VGIDSSRELGANTASDGPPSLGAYEKRVIAFVDILGFRSLLARMPQEPDLFETIRDALESVMEYGIASRQAPVLDRSYIPTGLEMTAFSDCYVISAKTGSEFLILNLARQLVLCLLEVGIISRGAIVAGELYHEHPVVFGQGLVDGYELETTAAHYPRILVAETVAAPIREFDEQNGTTYSEGIITDTDGCRFLDVFCIRPRKYLVTRVEASGKITNHVEEAFLGWLDGFSLFLRIRGHLVENLLREIGANRPNLNRLSKLRWLASRFNEAMLRNRNRIEPIDSETPRHEEEWTRNEYLRHGRELRPQKLPFTLEDVVQARKSSRKKSEK
jgi:hypothetical protein